MIRGRPGKGGGEGGGKSEQESFFLRYVSYNWLILERMPRCEADSSELGLVAVWPGCSSPVQHQSSFTEPAHSSQDGIASQFSGGSHHYVLQHGYL